MNKDIRKTDLYHFLLESYLYAFKNSKDAEGKYDLENATKNLTKIVYSPQALLFLMNYSIEEIKAAITVVIEDCKDVRILNKYGIGMDE